MSVIPDFTYRFTKSREMSDSEISKELKKTIPWQLMVIFLLFTVGLVLAGRFFYYSQRDRIYRERENNLSAITSLKIGQIQQWNSERLGDAAVIRDNGPLIRSIRQLFINENKAGIADELRQWMNSVLMEYDYKGVLLVDNSLKVRMTATPSDTVAGDVIQSELHNVLRNKKIIMTDLHNSKCIGYIHSDILIPIFDPENKGKDLLGIIILRVDPVKVLFPLIRGWPTSSKSSETVLLRKEGDSILYLNDLRHMKNTALNLRLPLSRESLLASKAIRGFEGIIEGVDYRNVPVVGFAGRVPGLPWFIVAKTDKEEIQTPIRRYFYITVFITILLILINASIFGFWIWNQRVRL